MYYRINEKTYLTCPMCCKEREYCRCEICCPAIPHHPLSSLMCHHCRTGEEVPRPKKSPLEQPQEVTTINSLEKRISYLESRLKASDFTKRVCVDDILFNLDAIRARYLMLDGSKKFKTINETILYLNERISTLSKIMETIVKGLRCE